MHWNQLSWAYVLLVSSLLWQINIVVVHRQWCNMHQQKWPIICCMCFYYYHFFGEIKMYIKPQGVRIFNGGRGPPWPLGTVHVWQVTVYMCSDERIRWIGSSSRPWLFDREVAWPSRSSCLLLRHSLLQLMSLKHWLCCSVLTMPHRRTAVQPRTQ